MKNETTTATTATTTAVIEVSPIIEAMKMDESAEIWKEIKTLCASYAGKLNGTKVLASERDKAAADLAEKVDALNDQVLSMNYDQLLKAENPIAAMMRRFHWSKAISRTTGDDGKKEVSTVYVSERFNLLSMIEYAKEQKIEFPNAEKIKTALDSFVTVFTSYIDKGLKTEAGVSMATVKGALGTVIAATGVEGVNARSKDIRWLEAACTKAGALSKLQRLSASTVAKYMTDMFYVQLQHKDYGFEEAKGKKGKK